MELKRTRTHINEIARRELGISRDEYAFCAYLFFRQGYPTQKVPGWCCDIKDELAAFVGITRPGLYKMCSKLERLGLIEQSAVGGYLRATILFIDSDNGVNKVDKASVNKVYTGRKQSLQKVSTKFTDGVNKVDEVNNSKIKKEEKEGERRKKTPQAAAPTPPQPENQNHTTGAGEIGTVEADFSKNPARPLSPFAAIQGPHIRDFVKADTPGEMLERIAAFYATPQGQNERERIYSDTIAGKMSAPERTEVTKAFAAWAVEQNYGQKTFRELNARFTRWWKDQARYNAEKQPATHTQHHSPLNNRPDGPVMRSAVQIQKLPCTTTLTASE